MTYYAHSKEREPVENWQTLEEHSENVAYLASKFAAVFSVPATAHTAGLLHDLGKYTKSFQEYLNKRSRGEDVIRGQVIHALQGAKFVEEQIKDPLIADIIGNIIATHHSGLFDNIAESERMLSVKTNKAEDKLHYEEVKRFGTKINEDNLKTEVLNFCRMCQIKNLNPLFMLHLLTKAIYSCLVDADRCDAARLEISDKILDWGNLTKLLENYLASFHNDTRIDRVRKNISEQCQKGGSRSQGIYTLSVPTGGGKTLSSLRFALEHAKQYNLKRVIYVIPYLSILDQTATKLREVFLNDSDELILEHHSNIEPPEDDEKGEQYNLLTSRWDSPIILTTMVQFLETIYSNKASQLRKFHNMSEAVFIFDEIQALPIKCLHLFNEAVNFLHSFGKSTILLCTATQPNLHKTERPILLSDQPDIVSLTTEDLKVFERVQIHDKTQAALEHEEIAALVKEQIDKGKSALVIMNTKGDAHKVYEQCKFIKCERAFLTTDLCPAHRLNILDCLRKNLSPKTKRLTLCVSTQLIEAGVDVSFDCVIRAEAGMNSIIQATGRCNRNKENPMLQYVFIVNVKDERLLHLPEIKDGKDITARVLREKQGKNLLSDEVIDQFYEYYFFNQQQGNNLGKMDFVTKDGKTTIYNLLNDNSLGTVAYKSRNNMIYKGFPCAFQTAADEFFVVDGAQTGIVVPYGDALQLVSAFQCCFCPKEKMRILKKLQKYTVSVYSNRLEDLERQKAIVKVDDSFYFLSRDYYDAEEQGLKREAMLSFLNI